MQSILALQTSMCSDSPPRQHQSRPDADRIASAAALALLDGELVNVAVVVDDTIAVASCGLVALLGGMPMGGSPWLEHVAEPDRARARAALDAASGRDAPGTIACKLVHRDGRRISTELRVASSDIEGHRAVLIVVHDLTEREAAEQRLRAIAHYDALTDLPNRILLLDRLTHGLASAARSARMLALLVIDLDGFKRVNDDHGHPAGDAVLREVARRLGHCIRSVDTLARVGGDEFVAVLPQLVHREDAGIVAARMVNVLRLPFEVATGSARIGASIGIAIFPDDGTQIEMLFARADSAMYAAKRAGKNQYAFADTSANLVLAADRFEWSSVWRLGIEVMDRDHEALFAQLSDLGALLAAGADESSIQIRLHRLVDFCARHFDEEERIMAAGRFAGLESHRAEHQRLLVDLTELAAHTHWVGASLTMRYLESWLVGHMQTYDSAAAKALGAATGDCGSEAA